MRPELLNPLFADVTRLPGVGPRVAQRLAKLGLERVVDVLLALPTGFRRTRCVATLAEAAPGERIAVAVEVVQRREAHGRAPARAAALDAAGQPLAILFFGGQANRLLARLRVGGRYRIDGQLESWNGMLQMAHPDQVAPLPPGAPLDAPLGDADGVEPVYPLTEGLTRRMRAEAARAALAALPPIPEWIAPGLLADRGWPGFAAALRAAHANPGAVLARDRLAHDELFAGQLAWGLVRARMRRRPSRALRSAGRLRREVLARLGFAPTAAQERAVAEILADMARPEAMLRLLQGDVGSGKTLVAALALAEAVEAGVQGAFLAPTELLARQHLATLERLFAGLPVRIGFLSGREKGRAREALRADLAAGAIDVLVGTHALFQEGVAYRDLGLAVIDEQHRFGVAQRLLLQRKAAQPPHLLVMTATPIPRTLALARHGAMDVSVLDERPPGRQPIDTRVIAMARLEEVLAGLGRHLAAGRRAYWVCPLVDDGGEGAEPDGEQAAAVSRAAMLRARFGEAVELVHGRMPGPAREAALARFVAGEAQLLVATTVIEVGVDVPEATLIVIEAAERFGLAQLHQLRGRVGRGGEKSVCLLLAGANLSETAKERLRMLRATDDGFAIAEADLKLRGPGELLGTRQAGEPGFRIATDEQAARLIAAADADARLLLAEDPALRSPRGEAARLLLYLFDRDSAVRTLHSG
ncbi:ATP-dependent DNA helicase RecG [Thermaurantiacus tibetensis]|uniref:ATP-dependent DNA helicase RecG n=1 Tax=Thermaurantiacus tibetensis TaxID=2759035 RepID=UPI00188E1387|nr:ATP-dependent DNA helicase RecG [Thermaurantiacus tibetensis]